MGEFFEPESSEPLIEKPKVFTNEFITSTIKKAMANGEIPVDHKLAFVGVVDERGARAIVSAQIIDKKLVNDKLELDVKIQGLVEHEWTGNNKAGAMILFSVK